MSPKTSSATKSAISLTKSIVGDKSTSKSIFVSRIFVRGISTSRIALSKILASILISCPPMPPKTPSRRLVTFCVISVISVTTLVTFSVRFSVNVLMILVISVKSIRFVISNPSIISPRICVTSVIDVVRVVITSPSSVKAPSTNSIVCDKSTSISKPVLIIVPSILITTSPSPEG